MGRYSSYPQEKQMGRAQFLETISFNAPWMVISNLLTSCRVAARGKIPTDFSDKKVANQAGEAITHFINFFEKTL
jgi:hypothetical protein